jgi:hypothetical protein
MPISTTRFRTALDGPLNIIAPLFGDVISIEKVLGYYRVHGRNLRAAQQFDAAKFVTLVQMKGEELAFLREWASKLGVRLAINPCHEASFVEHRIAALRLELQWPAGRRDKIVKLVAVATKNVIRSDEPLLRRILRLLVTLATVTAPKPMARRIVELRFLPMSRPHVLAAALRFARASRLAVGPAASCDRSDMADR